MHVNQMREIHWVFGKNELITYGDGDIIVEEDQGSVDAS